MNQNNRANSLPYLGRAPGDLPEIPNKGKETWLTDPVLIFIFMEVIPGIAAIIICFLALTVVSIGVSLLCKYFCLLYSRRLQFKRLKKQKRKISPMENVVEDSTDDRARESRRLKNVKSNPKETESVDEDSQSEEDAEYGILTGTKRKKKEIHVARHHHRHHRHHPQFEKNVRKHKTRHVVAKIMRRVRDGVMGKQKRKKPDPKKDSQEHHHHHYHQNQEHHHYEQHQPHDTRKSVQD